MIETDWYVAATEPQRERVAERALKAMGLAAYVPRRRSEVRRRGRWYERREPLFAGYVFLELVRGGEPWMRIEAAAGVIGVLGFGDPPVVCTVPALGISALMWDQHCGRFDAARIHSRLREGMQVRVEAEGDPQDRHLAHVVRVLSDARVVLQFGSRRALEPVVLGVRPADVLREIGNGPVVRKAG